MLMLMLMFFFSFARHRFGLAANVLVRALIRARELTSIDVVASMVGNAQSFASLLADSVDDEHASSLGGASRRIFIAAALLVAAAAVAVCTFFIFLCFKSTFIKIVFVWYWTTAISSRLE